MSSDRQRSRLISARGIWGPPVAGVLMDRAPGEQGKKTAQKDTVRVHAACHVWPELMEKADPRRVARVGTTSILEKEMQPLPKSLMADSMKIKGIKSSSKKWVFLSVPLCRQSS